MAQALRNARPSGTTIVSRDTIRREVLHSLDADGTPAVDLIEMTARFALDRGLHVIVEGILYAARYGVMLRRLAEEHRGITRCYLLDVPFEETLRRHRTKAVAGEFGEEQMRSWWQDEPRVDGFDEQIIRAASTLEETVALILADCGWTSSGTVRPGEPSVLPADVSARPDTSGAH